MPARSFARNKPIIVLNGYFDVDFCKTLKDLGVVSWGRGSVSPLFLVVFSVDDAWSLIAKAIDNPS